MAGDEGPQLGKLFALDFQHLAEEIGDSGSWGRLQRGKRRGGHIELKMHGSLISAGHAAHGKPAHLLFYTKLGTPAKVADVHNFILSFPRSRCYKPTYNSVRTARGTELTTTTRFNLVLHFIPSAGLMGVYVLLAPRVESSSPRRDGVSRRST